MRKTGGLPAQVELAKRLVFLWFKIEDHPEKRKSKRLF